jgi:hypothetical protein
MARPRSGQPYRSGPWRGMRQHPATVTDIGAYLELIHNGYLRDDDQAPIVAGRPGFTLAGAGGTPQLGSAGARTGQLIYHFTTRAGTEVRVAIVGGKIYSYDFGADAFTETVTGANLTTASITLSTSARIHAVTFADRMIISDGVNTPFAWDGTSGAGGLTKLTNCPVLYGQPWVKTNKLMGIKGTSTATRISIVWSEEGQVNTGYEAAGYTNIWDVIQTNSSIFVCGAATNDQIVLARQNSMTRILGDVTTDFRTTATNEAVHEFVGSLSPSGMLVHQDTVYVFANDGRIFRVHPGAAAEEIAIGSREYLSSRSQSKFGVVDSVVWDAGPFGEYLCWGVAGPSSDYPDTIILVDPDTGELVGLWDDWVQHRMGTWKNASGEPVLVHIGGASSAAVADGYVYIHGTPKGTVWTDGFQAGAAAITHSIKTHAMGWDERSEKYWDVAAVSVLLPSNLTALGVQATTPYGASAPISGASLTGGGSLWDVGLWDSATWGGATEERQIPVGIDATGRWCQIEVTHGTSGEQFAVQSIQVTSQVISTAPDTY